MSIINKFRSFRIHHKFGWDRKKIHIEHGFQMSSSCTILFQSVAYIGPNATISGSGTLHFGDNTIIGPNVQIMTSVHDYRTNMLPYDGFKNITKDIYIGKNCWIGSDVIIMPGVHINDGCVIGARSFINRDCPKCSVVVGTPGKVIKYRSAKKYSLLCKNKKLYLYQKYNLPNNH